VCGGIVDASLALASHRERRPPRFSTLRILTTMLLASEG
jgi:hypothetical protein